MGRQRCILVADDDEQTLALLAKKVMSLGHKAEVARQGAEVLEKLKSDIDLVVLGATLGKMEGCEVVRRIRTSSSHSDVPIVMMVPPENQEARRRALEAGANEILSSPQDEVELQVRATSLLKAREDIERQQMLLEVRLRQKDEELREAVQRAAESEKRVHKEQIESVQRLGIAAEYKSDEKGGHVQRVRAYCTLIAAALDLPKREIELAGVGSTMHDIGKIGVPDAVLLKQGELTEEEWQTMKQHTAIGAQILGGSSSELLQAGETIALSHHEQWDGGGYPKGLSGTAIPLYGRICKVADVFDAITNDRPYEQAVSPEKGLEMMAKGRGKYFDTKILDVFFANSHHLVGIQRKYPDGEVAAGQSSGG